MRVPHQLLRETVTIEDYAGQGARSASYGAPRTTRAAVQPTTRHTTDPRGNEVVADAVLIIRPEAGPVPAESKVTWAGKVYRVASVFPMPDGRRPSHYEITLTRWAS